MFYKQIRRMFQFYYFLTKFFNKILICDDKGIKKRLATCTLMCISIFIYIYLGQNFMFVILKIFFLLYNHYRISTSNKFVKSDEDDIVLIETLLNKLYRKHPDCPGLAIFLLSMNNYYRYQSCCCWWRLCSWSHVVEASIPCSTSWNWVLHVCVIHTAGKYCQVHTLRQLFAYTHTYMEKNSWSNFTRLCRLTL